MDETKNEKKEDTVIAKPTDQPTTSHDVVQRIDAARLDAMEKRLTTLIDEVAALRSRKLTPMARFWRDIENTFMGA